MKGQKETETSIGELVGKAQAGDRGAFDKLASHYRDRLEYQVRSRMGGKLRSRLEVEDVVQETFAVAFESIAKLRWRDAESFYRWLGSIAEHLIWSASQKKAWEQIRLVQDVAASGASPSKNLQRKERFDRLESALEGLSDDYRQVLILSRIEGLPVKEIAVRLNRSPDAIKKLLARALMKLKESFGETESFHLPDRRLRGEGESRVD